MWLAVIAVLLAALTSATLQTSGATSLPSTSLPVQQPADRYVCQLDAGPPARVRVYRTHGSVSAQIGPEFTYRHAARMASAADLDRDGRLDLLVLVWKTTRYDPQPAWRPFVYTLKDGEWVPKWLGSRLGRHLLEAALVRTPGGVRLLSIEDFGGGRTGFTLYHWRGFGFWGEWTGEPGPPQSELRVMDLDGNGIDEVSTQADNCRQTYAFSRGGYAIADHSCKGKR
jgi:hypothetical protein